MTDEVLLCVRDLRTYFDEDGRVVRAVDGVSFELRRGETLGIVGESGSGKSVTSLSIMRLVPSPPGRIASGEITFDGRSLLTASADEMRAVRGRRIAMIFQDPMTSLNPFMRIGQQLAEVTRLHLGHSPREARDHAVRMLALVGIPDAGRRVHEYPHQFSGGMRQRVMIAMALSCEPALLIADEPTTALDVTIQAQILELIGQLRREIGTSVILITHDLGVVAERAERVLVMYAGRVVEQGPVADVFQSPQHPYTRGLLRSLPRLGGTRARLETIRGHVPRLTELPSGCRFRDRCDFALPTCADFDPPLESFAADRSAACPVTIHTSETSGGRP